MDCLRNLSNWFSMREKLFAKLLTFQSVPKLLAEVKNGSSRILLEVTSD